MLAKNLASQRNCEVSINTCEGRYSELMPASELLTTLVQNTELFQALCSCVSVDADKIDHATFRFDSGYYKSGHGRATFYLNVELSEGSQIHQFNLACKKSNRASDWKPNQSDAQAEVDLCKNFLLSPLFNKHFSKSLCYFEYQGDLYQLETWKNGERLEDVLDKRLYILNGNEMDGVFFIKTVADTAIKCWQELKLPNGDGMIYDLGLDDVLLAPVESTNDPSCPVFIDADGGKRCGNEDKLWNELGKLRREIRDNSFMLEHDTYDAIDDALYRH